MKLTPDSPELTAFALGQLPPEIEAEIRRALLDAPELQAEVAEIRSLSKQLGIAFAAEPALKLAPEQRQAVLNQADLPGKIDGAAAGIKSRQVKPAPQDRPQKLAGWQKFREFLAAWQPGLGIGIAGAAALLLAVMLWPQYSRRVAAPATQEVSERLASSTGQKSSEVPVPTAESKSTEARYPANSERVKVLTAEVKDAADSVAQSVDSLAESEQKASLELAPNDGLTPKLNQQVGEVTTFSQDLYLKKEVENSAKPPDVNLVRRYGGVNVPTPTRGTQDSAKDTLAATSGGAAGAAFSPPPSTLADRSRESERLVRLQEARQLGRALQVAPGQQVAPPGPVYYRMAPETRLRAAVTPSLSTGTESYAPIYDNPFKDVVTAPLSTFSIDVDTASYANVRRFLREGQLPPPDAVRVEELINYFNYRYAPPDGTQPFATHLEVARCPWNPEHLLARIGIKGKTFPQSERPKANLVFLVDVSGSMEPENKLPLARRDLRLLVDHLREQDSVGIVTYAGEAGVALESTPGNQKDRILQAIERLTAGGSTHGSAGIQRAYELAESRRIKDGVNRVILCTDGDFNVGVTSREALLDLITQKAKSGVALSVLGFGMGNTKDDNMELLADKGNGNYAYIDSFLEARKVLIEQLDSTLVTIAKDVKIQVEFNPARVGSYRLIGYENRALRDRDFNDDTKDAGEIGAGHTVTALYELVPLTAAGQAGVDPLRYAQPRAPKSSASEAPATFPGELFFLKLRYKEPEGDSSKLLEFTAKDSERKFAQASPDFKFASSVAGYGMMLRRSVHKGDLTWDKILQIAESGLSADESGYRAEFIDLVRRAKSLSNER